MKNFENFYVYDYVIMTYRILTGKIDSKIEDKIIGILYSLLDEFGYEYIHKYVIEDRII